MDTRFWGPSGWKLLHMSAHAYNIKNKQAFSNFFEILPYVLPCKYCRKSLSEYYEEDPIDLSSPLALQKWLYRIHNKVNDKLRKQGQCIKNPQFSTVKKQYGEILSLSCSKVYFPGWDFLYSIAETHPSSKLVKSTVPIPGAPEKIQGPEDRNKWNLLTPEERSYYFNRFWETVAGIFPYDDWKTLWEKSPALILNDRKSLLKSLWSKRVYICNALNQENVDSFQGICRTLKDQRSGCGVSSRGKTCRKKRT